MPDTVGDLPDLSAALESALRRGGMSALDERARLVGALRAPGTADARAVNLLMTAYDAGVPGRLRETSEPLSEFKLGQEAAQVVENFGTRPDLARAAVEAWAAALAKAGDIPDHVDDPVPAASEPHEPLAISKPPEALLPPEPSAATAPPEPRRESPEPEAATPAAEATASAPAPPPVPGDLTKGPDAIKAERPGVTPPSLPKVETTPLPPPRELPPSIPRSVAGTAKPLPLPPAPPPGPKPLPLPETPRAGTRPLPLPVSPAAPKPPPLAGIQAEGPRPLPLPGGPKPLPLPGTSPAGPKPLPGATGGGIKPLPGAQAAHSPTLQVKWAIIVPAVLVLVGAGLWGSGVLRPTPKRSDPPPASPPSAPPPSSPPPSSPPPSSPPPGPAADGGKTDEGFAIAEPSQAGQFRATRIDGQRNTLLFAFGLRFGRETYTYQAAVGFEGGKTTGIGLIKAVKRGKEASTGELTVNRVTEQNGYAGFTMAGGWKGAAIDAPPICVSALAGKKSDDFDLGDGGGGFCAYGTTATGLCDGDRTLGCGDLVP